MKAFYYHANIFTKWTLNVLNIESIWQIKYYYYIIIFYYQALTLHFIWHLIYWYYGYLFYILLIQQVQYCKNCCARYNISAGDKMIFKDALERQKFINNRIKKNKWNKRSILLDIFDLQGKYWGIVDMCWYAWNRSKSLKIIYEIKNYIKYFFNNI